MERKVIDWCRHESEGRISVPAQEKVVSPIEFQRLWTLRYIPLLTIHSLVGALINKNEIVSCRPVLHLELTYVQQVLEPAFFIFALLAREKIEMSARLTFFWAPRTYEPLSISTIFMSPGIIRKKTTELLWHNSVRNNDKESSEFIVQKTSMCHNVSVPGFGGEEIIKSLWIQQNTCRKDMFNSFPLPPAWL